MTQPDVGPALGAAFGGGYVNYFSIAGRSYKVIPQVLQVDRLESRPTCSTSTSRTPNARSHPGEHRRASEVPTYVPESINRFQQLNSVTISIAADFSQGETLQALRDALQSVAPSGYNVDYSGPGAPVRPGVGRLHRHPLAFAIIIVFLALAAQFESFRDPVVILVSVPLALFGATIFIFLGFTRGGQRLHPDQLW